MKNAKKCGCFALNIYCGKFQWLQSFFLVFVWWKRQIIVSGRVCRVRQVLHTCHTNHVALTTSAWASTPVSLYLSHVRHASDAEAEVLPVEGSGDGASDGRLPHTRRPIEAHDLPLRGAAQLAHCDEFLHRHDDNDEAKMIKPAWNCSLLLRKTWKWWSAVTYSRKLTNIRFLTSSIP